MHRRNGIEETEIDLLVEAIVRCHGFDFRGYAWSSLRRRILGAVAREGTGTISGLIELVLHDPAAMQRVVSSIAVNVSAMFRDPPFFKAFRDAVVPLLRTYPFIRVWQAGCSMGEEVYSLAILLEEAGLYDRCRLYATDMSEDVLRQAREAVYPLNLMQRYTQNYIQAGGTRAFSEYYTATHEQAALRPSLQRNIVFSQHNLVTDGPFNEFHVVLCRNVLIYFNRPLQDQVHTLLHQSLTPFGVLGLGSKETLRFTSVETNYEPLVESERLYRRVA
ncbi:MAG: protein-glutamate O-methyltransferase CheR [Vicinamibacteraceae bacterium]|nr:protein-glutamate O-methyltransferase CheR [Vicinamibacteraceae bacterium]